MDIATPARAELEGTCLRCAGLWTVAGIEAARLPPEGVASRVDAAAIAALDTCGALLLLKLAAPGARWDGLRPEHAALLELVRAHRLPAEAGPPAREENPLAQLGRAVTEHARGLGELLAFIGEASAALGRALLAPRRLRWKPVLANLETAGFEALPIVGLLAFLMGVVIAYQGGMQLRLYGANIFIVELVGLTMLREMAVLMTAIIVAGRTGSAYAAQIGTMCVTEEVDALRTIGIRPMELLVLPKMLALMVALPLLTVFADILGVLGGMATALLLLDVSFTEFLDRLPRAVPVRHFFVGLGKAPVFAALIALVGCFQGFQVRGGAEAVGRQTTQSVVQAIFLVMVADAAFSVLFSWLKI